MLSRVLLVDDEKDFLESLERGLLISGFRFIRAETDPRKALDLFHHGEAFDIAILDITMPGMSGTELLSQIKGLSPTTECIMVTAADEASTAVQCLKEGAFNYLTKPLDLEELLTVIFKALERKNLLEIHRLGKQKNQPELANPEAFAHITTQCGEMFRLLREAELHAASMVPILITGETGTGKELLARAIHKASSRADQPFIPVNMTALSPSLFESEFYGHTKGAFTGAVQDRCGLLETASKGTLFLDEIGSLPLELQGKLLRVLQEGEYFKLGTSRPRKADVRFIAATNTELFPLQEQGLFRKDLFYRLCGAWLVLPPLHQRKEDIALLVPTILHKYLDRQHPNEIEDSTLMLLKAYDYPGNIRELKSIVQYAANLAKQSPITIHHLPAYVQKAISREQRFAQTIPREEEILPLAAVEKEYILRVFRLTGKNKLQTARLLHIGINTLRRKLFSYGENEGTHP
ncbi:MAG: sigma-54 dependent transcriptional regulator [Desulfobulbus sp.]|nr:sigma-54 dependent transcriptional regulator [Desulfobulbus sp.]